MQGDGINRDPIGEAGGINLYGFVGNDPVNRIDSYGLAYGDWWDPRTYSPAYARIVAENALQEMLRNRGYSSLDEFLLDHPNCGGIFSAGNLGAVGAAAALTSESANIYLNVAPDLATAGLATAATTGFLIIPKNLRRSQWGWRGGRPWNNAVRTVASGGEAGVIQNIGGRIPTYDEAIYLIKDAGGTVQRVDKSHAGSRVAGHIDFPHINFTTPSGSRSHLRIQDVPE